MKRVRRRSLVLDIALVLAMAGLAPVALSFFLLRSNENALEEQVLRTHLIASSTAADRVASFLQPFRDLARSLGESPVLIDDPYAPEAAALLRSSLVSQPMLGGLGLFDPDGETVLQAQRRTLREEGFDLTTGAEPGLAILRGEREWIRVRRDLPGDVGWVAAVLELEPLKPILQASELGDEAEMVLVDAESRILIGPQDALDSFPDSLLESIGTGKLGTGSRRFGETLVGFAAVQGSGWYVLSRQPGRVADIAVEQTERATRATALGALALVFLLSLGAIRITRPLKELTRFARELSRHEFGAGRSFEFSGDLKSISRRSNEIGELANTLEAMQGDLEVSVQRLQQTTAAKERMESELRVAQDIQMSLLPEGFPALRDRPEVLLHAHLLPAREVGGDLYEAFFVDDHHLCFCVGDVSGKGVPAALFMARTLALLQTHASSNLDCGDIVTRTNEELSRNNDACMFVTLALGLLDVRSGQFQLSNAGHNPPYIRRRDGQLERLDEVHGPAVGVMEGIPYAASPHRLSAGDALLLYTDGVTEAQDAESTLYSEERMVDMLDQASSSDPEKLVESVFEDVLEFQGQAEQADDITLLGFRYEGAPEATS